MSSLEDNQEAKYECGVRAFAEAVPIRVTPEKLRSFLEGTRDINASAARRLRELAIRLEYADFDRGWEDLRLIYEAAAEADPHDPLVLHSWGIAARRWAEAWITPALSEREAIARDAERVLHAALELVPKDSMTAHALGLLYYHHPSRAQNREVYRSCAIEWFSRAVEWDSGNLIAQLYLAHCFHDRRDWPRAIAEYEKINLDQLAREWPAWRAVKCREQLAQCYAWSGNRDEAVRRFTALLNEVETWDLEKMKRLIVNFDELAVAVTEILGDPTLFHRVRTLIHRLGLVERYQHLNWREPDDRGKKVQFHDAKPDTASNSGPTTQLGISGVTEGHHR